MHLEFEDPSSSSTEIRGTLEEIVEGLITNLIFHVVVPDHLEYGSRGDPLLTQFARGWRGFYDHEEVGGLVTFWRLEGVSQALACHLLDLRGDHSFVPVRVASILGQRHGGCPVLVIQVPELTFCPRATTCGFCETT